MAFRKRQLKSSTKTLSSVRTSRRTVGGQNKPLVSLAIPAYNEATILKKNLAVLCEYMRSLERDYDWEIVLVNDGSRDESGTIAEEFARGCRNVRVLHHPHNMGMGQALRSAFNESLGNYVVTIDVDLSYSPDHIERLLAKMRETRAKIVLASPYMNGGSIANVPWFRRILSVAANRFLAFFGDNLSTLTCMVRAYDGAFIRGLSLRSTGKEVMPEAIFKARILRSRMEQIPARLDWGPQLAGSVRRRSSLHLQREVLSTLVWGYIFRPFTFFIAPGTLLLMFSAYVVAWMFIHFFEAYFDPSLQIVSGSDRISAAISSSYSLYPYTFIVGLLSLMLAVQLMGLGMMALQSKKYFDELFHITSGILREHREHKGAARRVDQREIDRVGFRKKIR